MKDYYSAWWDELQKKPYELTTFLDSGVIISRKFSKFNQARRFANSKDTIIEIFYKNATVDHFYIEHLPTKTRYYF